ncbi:hypothetical protein ACFWJQ_36380, partial [Streptomyces goshikiensis]
GPLRITGRDSTAHSPRTAAIAALIHLRPGRTADALCQAMDPANPWSTRTLHSRLSELRSAVGLHTDGQPLLPRPKAGAGYVFHPAVTSDWARFQALARQGLAAGPGAGIEDLEAAMALVRGKPFGGRTLPWADPVVQDMLSRITDTAHALARWQTDSTRPDLDAARHTVHKGLEVEETSEVLYRDLLTIEWAAGNTAAIRRTVTASSRWHEHTTSPSKTPPKTLSPWSCPGSRHLKHAPCGSDTTSHTLHGCGEHCTPQPCSCSIREGPGRRSAQRIQGMAGRGQESGTGSALADQRPVQPHSHHRTHGLNLPHKISIQRLRPRSGPVRSSPPLQGTVPQPRAGLPLAGVIPADAGSKAGSRRTATTGRRHPSGSGEQPPSRAQGWPCWRVIPAGAGSKSDLGSGVE